jgi:hypothetical protein
MLVYIYGGGEGGIPGISAHFTRIPYSAQVNALSESLTYPGWQNFGLNENNIIRQEQGVTVAAGGSPRVCLLLHCRFNVGLKPPKKLNWYFPGSHRSSY